MSNAKLIEHLRTPAKSCGYRSHCRCVCFIRQLEDDGRRAADALERADKKIEELERKIATLEGRKTTFAESNKERYR